MTQSKRKKLLLIGPLPPPFAGPEIGTKTLLESQELNRTYEIRNINTTVRTSNKEKGQLDLLLICAYFKYLFALTIALIKFKPEYILYCPTSATLKGWVRDGTTLWLCGLFDVKVVMQFQMGHFRFFFESLGPMSQRVIRWLLQRSALVLVQGDSLRDVRRAVYAVHVADALAHDPAVSPSLLLLVPLPAHHAW